MNHQFAEYVTLMTINIKKKNPQHHNSLGKYKFKLQCDKIVHAAYDFKF